MGGRAGGQASQSGACSDGIKEHQVPGGTLLELLRHVEHALLECLPVAVQLHPQSESVCGGEGTTADQCGQRSMRIEGRYRQVPAHLPQCHLLKRFGQDGKVEAHVLITPVPPVHACRGGGEGGQQMSEASCLIP